MKMTNRVIFLDFDGVIVSPRAMVAFPDRAIYGFDPVAIALLNRLCKETDAKVVVSSVWRISPDIEGILRAAGFTGWVHDDARTSDTLRNELSQGGRRGTEISNWLDRNPGYEYVILDDEVSDMQEHKERIVHCDMYNGFMLEHWERATALFENRKSDL